MFYGIHQKKKIISHMDWKIIKYDHKVVQNLEVVHEGHSIFYLYVKSIIIVL